MSSQPKKWKFAIIVWLAIYPTITTIFIVFGKYLIEIPILLRTLVLTGFLVPFMVYVGLPILTKLFSKWLRS